MRTRLLVLGSVALVVGALALPPSAPARTPSEAAQALASVRLPFIANEGQVDARVAYYAHTFAGTVFVTRQGQLVYALGGPRTDAGRHGHWSLTETLVEGRARPVAKDRSATGVSTFVGPDPARWRAALLTWEQVSLGEVWPGVSVALRARGRNIEKVFTVRPGGAVARVRVAVAGAKALTVADGGALLAATGLGDVTFTAPVAYQERDGVRRPVRVAYRTDGFEYGFAVGAYDPALPLVIDPLLQSTYLGGAAFDEGDALAIHPTTGDVYVAGLAESSVFPGTAGGAQPAFGGFIDAFVARFSSTLTTLIQATFLGGTGIDRAHALAIHPTTGDVYVAGETTSTDFPGTAGGAQPAFGGGVQDTFVARLTGTLTTLVRATYLGGGGFDAAGAVTIHPATGDVYVSGATSSSPFPGTAGGAQPAYGGIEDAFVARFSSTLTSLIQATYLGGGDFDAASAVAIHPTNGDVYVVGITNSSAFPGTAGGAQPVSGGLGDAFVARLPRTLTALTQATYLGGSSRDAGRSLAFHPATGEVYVTGETGSTDFPRTAGGAQPASGGGTDDAFVARLGGDLTGLIQATYLGGNSLDLASQLAIHPVTGDVYVVGLTHSTDFPRTAGGAQPAVGGNGDAFVARLTSSLALIDPAAAIPTLSELALLALAALLLATGALAARRRRSTRVRPT